MKKNLFALLMLATVFLAASCSKDEVEEPTLTLSETSTITLPKAVSEKTVTVTTNQTEWTAMANVNWIELVQSGTTLTIKTTENFESNLRKGEVMVMAGGLGRKLMIEQAASDATIVTIPDKLELDQWGGKYQFDVNANTKDWKVTSDADWVKVLPKQFKSEVLIEVAENEKREARVAKLTLTAGNTAKEFTITQSGIMYHIMPYLQFGASLGQLQAFETARRSEMVQDINLIFGGPYTFNTKSLAFPSIVYTFTTQKLSGATLNSSLKKEELGGAEIDKMLTDNKFKLINQTTTSKIYEQDFEKVTLRATISLENKGKIVFIEVPKQPQAYPTFEKFPYGLLDFGKADEAAIAKWEDANQGKFNKDKSEPGFFFYDAPLPWVVRLYFMTEKAPFILDQTGHAFKNLNLGIFEYNETPYLTNEFKALLEKEGFTLLKYDAAKKSFYYYKKEKELVLSVRPFQNALIAGGEKVLFFNIWNEKVDAGNINSIKPRDL